jgi:hypothetical protein
VRRVRQALGQLLDYAANATQPVRRLTALFPEAPAPAFCTVFTIMPYEPRAAQNEPDIVWSARRSASL